MRAVIETGGKQYHVAVGEKVSVEKLPVSVGERVEFDRVLLVAGEQGTQIGKPVVEGAKVIARVTEQALGPKQIVFKYRPKKRYRVKRGHRQPYTRLLVEEILS